MFGPAWIRRAIFIAPCAKRLHAPVVPPAADPPRHSTAFEQPDEAARAAKLNFPERYTSSSPSRGAAPPRRFMILSKVLKSARAFRSSKNRAVVIAETFRNGHGHKLVDARAVLLAEEFDRLFERSRQAQGIRPDL